MEKYSIGVDFGGTKILACIVNTETAEIVYEVKNKTKKQHCCCLILQRKMLINNNLFTFLFTSSA